MERRRECIEALKQLAGSDDSNHDEVVRMRVKDCIEPEVRTCASSCNACSKTSTQRWVSRREDWSYAKVFVQSMLRYMDTEW